MTNGDYLEKVKEFVQEEFKEAEREGHLKHLERTIHWVKQLEPKPSISLLVAAYSHDIEHAERWKDEDNSERGLEEIDFTDTEKLERHQKRSAEIIGEFLEKKDTPEEMISEVRNLVSRHEFGGTEEQDILKDADSLSFLENNVESFLELVGERFRKEDVRQKFDFMFERISTEEAREIARPWYRDAVKRLEGK